MDKQYLKYTNTATRSPGPAAYFVKPTIGKDATDPTIKNAPAYSLRDRTGLNVGFEGPGPKYATWQMNRYGKYKPPGVKLGVPFPEKKASETPGPAHYCPKWPVDNRGFQMGKLSERPPKPPVGPAPNAYHLPSTLYSRPMVMGGRPREAATWSSPEPGKYDIPPLATKRGISFGKRIEVKSNNPTPGPADYYVTDVCCKSGTKDAKFTTFGSRRPVVTGFAVPGDNDTY